MPIRFSFLNEEINRSYLNEKKTISAVLLFSIVSIIISGIGLLGLILFVSESKVKEIGIRKVNGASVKNILTLLSKDILVNVIVAIMISIPIGWFASIKWLENFAYKTSTPWWIFIVVVLSILSIVRMSIGYHTVRAAHKNPVETLRYE
jgi:putative ABC transport system permease protein